jgi:chemotaxis protein methyltransferase CheR
MNAALHQPRRVVGGEMSDVVFASVSRIAHREAGLVLAQSKMAMVKSRLTRRLRVLKLPSFEDYIEFVENPGNASEMPFLVSALTTNVSHFFREKHHFDRLKSEVLPPLLKKAAAGGRVRIWSAGCSNGQETYSLAMTLLEMDPNILSRDVRILGTDIDNDVLQTAREGFYANTMLSGLEDQHLRDWFSAESLEGEEGYRVSQKLRDLVTYRKLNLHGDWPMNGCFDIIFCRNVVIYFDEDTQTCLYQRFQNILSDDGWLFLGHSERIGEAANSLFTSSGVTAYRVAKGA